MEPNSDDLEQCFEPLGRCRSFTWHGNLKEYGANGSPTATSPHGVGKSDTQEAGGRKDDNLNLKKPSTRRNAWGCMSYADLITKAIESVPEKRLTLSQIYGWMIQNVPYFKDKGESNSSAGWKNSIRHNLSLHRKFVRVQNEGTGKSSWWIVNNEVKTCKSPRRRASSMDKSYDKKKHRQATVPANVEEQNVAAGYPKSSVVPSTSEVYKLDSFAMAFSPVDLRANGRTATLNASHLSPIEPIPESPFDEQVMTQPSPLYWNQCHSVNTPYTHPEGLTETVGESLAELFPPDVSTTYEPGFSPDHRLTVLQNVSNDKFSPDASYLPFQDVGIALPSPPPYTGHPVASGEGMYPQVSPDVRSKELLQSSLSNAHSDSYSGMQYMTRSSYGLDQNVSTDVPAIQKYYMERNGESFSADAGNNSVLRLMLMQKTVQHPGFSADPSEPSVKPEPTTCNAFSYPDAHSTVHCSRLGLPNSSSAAYVGINLARRLDVTQSCELGSTESNYATNLDSEHPHQGVKPEKCEEAWDFSAGMGSSGDNGK